MIVLLSGKSTTILYLTTAVQQVQIDRRSLSRPDDEMWAEKALTVPSEPAVAYSALCGCLASPASCPSKCEVVTGPPATSEPSAALTS